MEEVNNELSRATVHYHSYHASSAVHTSVHCEAPSYQCLVPLSYQASH